MDKEELDIAMYEMDAAHAFYNLTPTLENLKKILTEAKAVVDIIQGGVDDG